MPLLLDEDYIKLADFGLSYEEDQGMRFFVFTNYQLPDGLYTVEQCDVLVMIPQNYNQAGNDMFWTFPSLQRADGKVIPQILGPGGGDNRTFQGKEFCRWSRHWNPSAPGAWRAGKDNIITIYRRIEWALKNPDAQ